MDVLLETERLVLRRFTLDDVDLVVELDSDPDVTHFVTGGLPTSRAEVRDEVLPYWLTFYANDDGFGYWAALDRATGEFLGWFHFRPHRGEPRDDGSVPTGVELGYRLRRSAWGRGLATEGSVALIRYGFTSLSVERVYAETMAAHPASRRVMEKAGLRYVSTFHQDWPYPIPGDELGDVEYALTVQEWREAQGSSGSGRSGGSS